MFFLNYFLLDFFWFLKVNSINEGIKLQSQNRPQRSRKQQQEEISSGVNLSNIVNQPGTISNNGNGTDSGNRETSSSSGSLGESTRQISNPPSVRSTPSPVPSNTSYESKAKRARSVLTSERSEESESNSELDCRTEGNDSNIDTEGENNSELGMNDEIELVFKPHPTEMTGDNQLMKALKENSVRYIKTTANASGTNSK